MNHEYEQNRTSSPAAAKTHNDASEPGQSSSSAALRKPEHAIASGLVQREGRDADGVAADWRDGDWTRSGGDALVADIKAEAAAWEQFRAHPSSYAAMPGKKVPTTASKLEELQFRVGTNYTRQKLGVLNTAILTEMCSINNIDCGKLQGLIPGVSYLKPQHRYEMRVRAGQGTLADKMMKKLDISMVTVKYTNSFGWTWTQNLSGSLLEISAGLKLSLNDLMGGKKPVKGGIDAGKATLQIEGVAVARPLDYWGPENLAGATRATQGTTGSAKIPVGGARFQTGRLIDLFGNGAHGGPLQFENFDATANSSLSGGNGLKGGEISITFATLQSGGVVLDGGASFETGQIAPHLKQDMYLWSDAIDDFVTGDDKIPIPPDKVKTKLDIPKKEIEAKRERLKDVQTILKEQFGIDEHEPKLVIKVTGYASRSWASTGADDKARLKLNQDLSQRRADAVAATVKQAFGPEHDYTVSGKGAALMLPDTTTPTPEIDRQGHSQDDLYKQYQAAAEQHGTGTAAENHRQAKQQYGRTSNEREDRRVEIMIQWTAHTVEWTGAPPLPPAKK